MAEMYASALIICLLSMMKFFPSPPYCFLLGYKWHLWCWSKSFQNTVNYFILVIYLYIHTHGTVLKYNLQLLQASQPCNAQLSPIWRIWSLQYWPRSRRSQLNCFKKSSKNFQLLYQVQLILSTSPLTRFFQHTLSIILYLSYYLACFSVFTCSSTLYLQGSRQFLNFTIKQLHEHSCALLDYFRTSHKEANTYPMIQKNINSNKRDRTLLYR